MSTLLEFDGCTYLGHDSRIVNFPRALSTTRSICPRRWYNQGLVQPWVLVPTITANLTVHRYLLSSSCLYFCPPITSHNISLLFTSISPSTLSNPFNFLLPPLTLIDTRWWWWLHWLPCLAYASAPDASSSQGAC